jgi:hypothetical protein
MLKGMLALAAMVAIVAVVFAARREPAPPPRAEMLIPAPAAPPAPTPVVIAPPPPEPAPVAAAIPPEDPELQVAEDAAAVGLTTRGTPEESAPVESPY